MEKTLLLIVDPQNDFVDPRGSLFVQDSPKAIEYICKFIDTKNPTEIIVSQDSHQYYNIGFPKFWNIPGLKAFDKIRVEDIVSQKVKPVYIKPDNYRDFYRQFEDFSINDELTIWPYHCIEGSWGWCFPEALVESLGKWSLKNKKTYQIYRKGFIPELEAYSIFPKIDMMGNVEIESPKIQEHTYSNIYISGFCKDICVAESVKYIWHYNKNIDNLVFLDNCMSTLDKNSPNLDVYNYMLEVDRAKIENV